MSIAFTVTGAELSEKEKWRMSITCRRSITGRSKVLISMLTVSLWICTISLSRLDLRESEELQDIS